jgi:hypothetical protein
MYMVLCMGNVLEWRPVLVCVSVMLSESNWPDAGSIGTETCFFLYFNKLYLSVVFRRNILLIYKSWFDSRHE